MYKVLKDNKIIGVVENRSETDKKYHPDLIVEEDTEHTIEDYIEVGGEYVLTTDKKAKEKKENDVKAIRDEMINSITWRVERSKEQTELGLTPIDDYKELLEYRQYLRDYPDKKGKWHEKNPMTFEEWKEAQKNGNTK